MAKVLLDSNVLIDYFDENRREHETSKQAVDALFSAEHEIFVAATSCKDVYYILGRLLGENAARACIQSLFFTMHLLAVDNRVAYEGFHSDEPDFEDGIIRACAELNKMEYLVTRDEAAFANLQTKKVSPARMLEILSARPLATRDGLY